MFKAVLKSNLKRYWWIFALHTAMFALCFISPVINDMYQYRGYYSLNTTCLICLNLIFGALNGWCAFMYINSARAVNLFHSLPSTRTSIFLANILYGSLSVALPNLLLAAILPPLTGGYEEVQLAVSFPYIFINGTLVGLCALALACFTVMFSGNAAAGMIFTPIIAAVPFFLLDFLDYMHTELLYGSDGIVINLPFDLSDPPYNQYYGFTITLPAVLIVILILLGGAYIAFRRRQMECAGEIVTVKWAKVLFIQGMALCFAIALTQLVCGDGTQFLPYIIFGLIAAAAAMMVLQKTYRIKGYIKQAVAYVVIISLIFGVFAFDITGFERRVPDPDKVESVTLNFSGPLNSTFYAQSNEFTDPEIIEKISALHKRLVEERPDPDAYDIFPISYKLKNGSHMSRRYKLPRENIKDYLGELAMCEPMKNHIYLLDIDWSSVRYNNDQVLSTVQAKELKAALAADVAEADFDALYPEAAEYSYTDTDKESAVVTESTDSAEEEEPLPYISLWIDQRAKDANNKRKGMPEVMEIYHIELTPKLPRSWEYMMGILAESPEAENYAVMK